MIKSKILIDLPSEEADRQKTLGEWMGSLVGKKYDLRSGEEEVTVTALSLVAGISSAFDSAGINNAISLLVDRKVIYIDHHDVDGDLPLLLEAAEKSKVFQKPFDEMHVVLDHKEVGLHTIVDVRIMNRVVLGEEEMEVVLSSRVEELRVQVGETATEYGARVGQFAQRSEALDSHRALQDDFTQRIADQLRQALVGASVRREPARVEIIRPEARQIGRFRDLSFSAQVQPASYRPVPTHHRGGAYADPFYYYYYDPYYDLTSWMMVSMMLDHGCMHAPYISVVSPRGELVFNGDDQAAQSAAQWDGAGAVTLADDGGLAIADTIPVISSKTDNATEIAGADADFRGSGFSISDGGGDGLGGFFSDMFSGDGGSSSCGSSCTSASCGSSCGGGCGGGCSS